MMKFFKILSAVLLLVLITQLSTAQTLTGTVLDKKTNQPLVFATVQIGEKYGVITNDEGVFNIHTHRFSETDSIKFSSMGYTSTSFMLKGFSLSTIHLEEKIDELGSIYLVNKNVDPLVVMQRVVENKFKNYGNDLMQFNTFGRAGISNNTKGFELKLKKADFTDKEAIKAFNSDIQDFSRQIRNKTTSMYFDNYSEVSINGGKLKVNEQKTTQLINREENTSLENLQEKVIKLLGDKIKTESTFKVKSGILPIDDEFKFEKAENLFSEKDTTETNVKNNIKSLLSSADLSKSNEFEFLSDIENYNYTLTDVTGYQDEMVYVLTFNPRKRKANYQGTLYISADTYAVLKMEYELAEKRVAEKANYKFLLGIKYVQDFNSGIIIYQKTSDKYFPKYIQNHTNNYIYFGRSFSFKENAPRRDRMDIKLKLDFTIETNVSSRQELLIVDSRPITAEEYNAAPKSQKAIVEVIQKYDPALWESYNIIAPNEAIKGFEF